MIKRRLLFVCSANLQRSPTAEDLFQNWNGKWETKSAGTMPSFQRNLLTQDLVNWADLILVMEPDHAEYVKTYFNTPPDKVKALNIPDMYFRNDPRLIEELRRKVIPILENSI